MLKKRTYVRRQWNRARLNKQRDHVISARARLYRERGCIACAISALHLVCFTWISMMFVYTGVFFEYNIIIQ